MACTEGIHAVRLRRPTFQSRWLQDLGVMQDWVYKMRICDMEHLKERLPEEWASFDQNIIDSAINEWRARLRACVRLYGLYGLYGWRRTLWANAVGAANEDIIDWPCSFQSHTKRKWKIIFRLAFNWNYSMPYNVVYAWRSSSSCMLSFLHSGTCGAYPFKF